MSVKVVNGVVGDSAFGDDSPLYGAMGFVRKSVRKSGLTKKPKNLSLLYLQKMSLIIPKLVYYQRRCLSATHVERTPKKKPTP